MEEVKSFPKGFCKGEVELLKPIKVDHFTGHRHYFPHQLPCLNRSLALKNLGFSLERIKLMLADGPTLEQLRGMLKMQRREVEKRLSDEQERVSSNPRFA